MSKYTTEVRFYCEEMAGFDTSQDYTMIDEVVTKAAPKIFANFPIWDESYRLTLETKILRHYYTREICAETPGLWKLWLNNRLNEIMPYYNQLYKSAELEFNPFHDVDLTRDHVGEDSRNRNYGENGTVDTTGNQSQTQTGKVTTDRDDSSKTNSSADTNATGDSTTTSENDHTNDHLDKYSDTPQGSSQGPIFTNYLTNAREVSDQYNDHGSGTSHSTEDSHSDSETTSSSTSAQVQDTTNNNDIDTTQNQTSKRDSTETINNTDKFLEHVYGKQGTQSYSYLLLEYRKTLLNIDMMIINELNDLFMMVY